MSTKNLSTRLALNAILRCSYTVLPKTLIQLQIYYNFMTDFHDTRQASYRNYSVSRL